MDGFGTCFSGTEGEQGWWQNLYFNDLQASMLRMDLTPVFKSPYSDYTYNSPWFHNNPSLPGPDNNNALGARLPSSGWARPPDWVISSSLVRIGRRRLG